jgi:hypothetical protein
MGSVDIIPFQPIASSRHGMICNPITHMNKNKSFKCKKKDKKNHFFAIVTTTSPTVITSTFAPSSI